MKTCRDTVREVWLYAMRMRLLYGYIFNIEREGMDPIEEAARIKLFMYVDQLLYMLGSIEWEKDHGETD